MSFNLALILTILTLLSGIVVLLNRFVWKLPEDARGGGLATLVEYSRSFFPVLLLVLVLRSFVFEPFRIPSGSMMPTLLQGDFIFVKKYSYGLRLPVLETKVVATGEPERGDVVVFRLPASPNINYIKRIVGLPGDTVEYRDHRLTVNGEQVELQRASDYSAATPRFVERLGDREHSIYIHSPQNRDGEGSYVVPEGHFFVMGDNRDRSKDSRFLNDVGFIPETHLVGEASRIWLHVDGFRSWRWDRIGMKIE
ncbi:MAG: signal peptidase I [Pseudomonadota bacterium]